MAEYFEQWKTIFTLFALANVMMLLIWPVYLLLERWSPVDEDLGWKHYWFNWRVSLFNLLFNPFFSALVTVSTLWVASLLGAPGFAYPLYTLSIGIPLIDSFMQGFVMFLVACLLTDLWYYWWHRWQHRIPALWELHKLHHSDERLNMTTMPRSHMLERAGQALVRGLSVGLVFDLNGANQTAIAVFAVGVAPALWNFFIHSNVRFERLHRLLPLFSTPQYHRVHHSKLPQHHDCNFCIYWPLIDRLFGTYFHPERDEYPPTGLADGERIETMWDAQAGPFQAWYRMLRR